ncbi:hypothetical protein CHELA1G11_12967 [Hyphomicrobiales bacterium]|nr:hypothetical protein CHELA1G2_11343 [Hyphomicrobiales bacterium]CAH1668377.1 hypothetical protein CHELA1G11_12967 [Hyphomicrobiales bacterium]
MARPKYPSDEVDKTMVRFPPGLMDRIKTAAAENHRSMNAEIIARLESTFYAERNTKVIDFGGPDVISVEDLIEWLKERKATKP